LAALSRGSGRHYAQPPPRHEHSHHERPICQNASSRKLEVEAVSRARSLLSRVRLPGNRKGGGTTTVGTVVDDEIARPGDHREEFLDKVKRTAEEFVFCTGQDGEGRNSVDLVLEAVRNLWEDLAKHRLSMLLLDVRFHDPLDTGGGSRFGFKLLRALRERFGRALPVVMLTSVTEARGEANTGEADGFLPKDHLTPDALKAQLFRNGVYPESSAGVLGVAPAFLLTLREVRRAVASGMMWEFLLLGEPGAGKSELARFVHRVSGRTGRFVPWFARTVNVELHYDKLFGHWKGAFDGAKEHKAGSAEEAHAGTLFIDEIAELAPETQVDFLQYRDRHRTDGLRRVHRLGSTPTALRRGSSAAEFDLYGTHSPQEDRILVDSVIVCATNMPIDDEEWRRKAGFRADFFSSLGLRIGLPPLRERREDVVPLFLEFARTVGREIRVSSEVRQALEAHEWREGNIRELGKVAEQALAALGPDFDEVQVHHVDRLLAAAARRGQACRADAPAPVVRVPAVSAASQGGDAATFVEVEVRALWGLAQLIRAALVETRRPTGLGSLADILKQATGIEYAPTDVKREVKSLLEGWFAPNSRQKARWARHADYDRHAREIQGDPLLSSLYRYANGEVQWDEAKATILKALEK